MSQSDVIKNVSRLAKALNLHLRALDSYSKNKTNSFKLNMTGKYRKINKFLTTLDHLAIAKIISK